MNHTARFAVTLLAGLAAAATLVAQQPAAPSQDTPPTSPTITLAVPPTHVVVARAPGRYGGWPANHGIWAWGNEILVGFSWGHMRSGGAEAAIRSIAQRPEEHMLARSLDGGETWKHEKPAGLIPPPDARATSRASRRTKAARRSSHLTTPIDFTRARFRADGAHERHQRRSLVVLLHDRQGAHRGTVRSSCRISARRASRRVPTTSWRGATS